MDKVEEYSQFVSPKKDHPHRLVRVTPPLCHVVSYATGGITALYKKLQDHSYTSDQHEPGDFTDDQGAFLPRPDMPLIAFRYQYVDTIGEGQSCMFIKARDTFQDDALIAIKVLHTTYMQLGAQEMDCIRRINLADPYGTSSTLRLHNVFMFDNHYCMVFDLLHPRPLTDYFKEVTERKALRSIRLVAFKLLQVLGFLKKQNVIHADLKPENVLLEEEGDMLSLKVVDFGNAIHCVHDEVSLYYDDFELQTLLYRAPEVMFGTQFSTEIDMWSLGCILAELYMKRAIFFGRNKKEILQQTVQVLGPFPCNLFQMGKFYTQNKQFTGSSPQKDATYALMTRMNVTHDYHFANFISGMLKFDTKERMTPAQAARHPFLASVCGFRHLTEDMTDNYDPITLNRNTYKSSPAIAHEVVQKHLSSKALLKEGTKTHLISRKRGDDSSMKQVAEVVPVKRTCKGGKSRYEAVASSSGLGYDELDGIPGITVQRTLTDIMNMIHDEEDQIEEKMELSHSAGQRDSSPFRHQWKVPVRILENKCQKSPEVAPFGDRLMVMRMQRLQQQSNKRSRTSQSRDTKGDAFSIGGSSDWTEGSVVDSTASSRLGFSDSGRHTRDHRERFSHENRNNCKRRQSFNDVQVNTGAPERDSESQEVIEIKTEPVDPAETKENVVKDDDYRLPTLLLSPSARPLRPPKKSMFSESPSHAGESDLAQSRGRSYQLDTHKQRILSRQNMLDSDRTSSSYHGAQSLDTGKSSGWTDRSEKDFDQRRTLNKFFENDKGAFKRTKNSSLDRQCENSSSVENKDILIPKKGVLDKLVSNLKKSQTVGRNSDEFQLESGGLSYSCPSQGSRHGRGSVHDRRTESRKDDKNFSHGRKEVVLQTASGIRFRESSLDRDQRQLESQEKHRSRHKSVTEVDQRILPPSDIPSERTSLGPELAQSPTEKKEWYDFIAAPEDKRKHLFSKQTSDRISKHSHDRSPRLNLLSPVNFDNRHGDISSKGKKRTREQVEDDPNSRTNKITKTARRQLMTVLDTPGSPRRKEIEMRYSDIPDHVRVRGKQQSLCMSSGESRISCSSVSPSMRKHYAKTKKEAIFQESKSEGVERVGNTSANRRSNQPTVSLSQTPPRSSKRSRDQFDNCQQSSQHNRQRVIQSNHRGSVPQILSPLTGDGYKFDSDSEIEEESTYDRSSPARTSKLPSHRDGSQDCSPGRYQDTHHDSDDNHSNAGSNVSKAFRVSPKQVTRPTSRCASPVEEWHSPRHFSQPATKKTTPVYSTGKRRPVTSTATADRAQNSNRQSRAHPVPAASKHSSGSFLDSPVTSDEEGTFNGGKKPMVDTSIRGKPVKPGATSLVSDTVLGPEDEGGHRVTPSLKQSCLRLQQQQRIVQKKPLPQTSNKSHDPSQIRHKAPDINRNYKNPVSRDSSAESLGRTPFTNGGVAQRNSKGKTENPNDINHNYRKPFSRDPSAESQGRKLIVNAGQRNSNNRKESPVASTSTDRNQSQNNGRSRPTVSGNSRDRLLSDSSPSPSPGRTRAESKAGEQEENEDAVSATGRPQRKCRAKKKVTFDASDDSIGSLEDSFDPSYDGGDNETEDDITPPAKKKRATRKRTPVKSKNAPNGMLRDTRASDVPYYSSRVNYNEQEEEEEEDYNPYGYAGKPKNLIERNDYRSGQGSFEADGCVLLNL
ncbi:uncharacterized protein LOC135484554 isoform X2 [Lineus longissimus]|uniref:uncharacterized protein LOC135484554 isoform X2 n=1 Tax=Lineus longissimus TaxID=88925 RepID=UPI00315CC73F